MLFASFNESMIIRSSVFLTIIGINIVDLIRTLGNNSVYEKRSSTVLGFIRKNLGIQFSGEIIDSYEKVFTRLIGKLTFQQRKPFSIEVNEFTWIRLVIALGLALEMFLDGLLNLSQTFKTVLQCFESLVCAITRSKFLESGTFKYLIYRWTSNMEVFRQLHYLP